MAIRTYAPEFSGAQAYRAPETHSPARHSAKAIDAATVRATTGLVMALQGCAAKGAGALHSYPDVRVARVIPLRDVDCDGRARGPSVPNEYRPTVETPADMRLSRKVVGRRAAIVATQREILGSLAEAQARRDNARALELEKLLARTERELRDAGTAPYRPSLDVKDANAEKLRLRAGLNSDGSKASE